MPTKFGSFEAHAFRSLTDNIEHIALCKGGPWNGTDAEPLLVRVHSECCTGDVFGSLRCDCGTQLEAALRRIEAEGTRSCAAGTTQGAAGAAGAAWQRHMQQSVGQACRLLALDCRMGNAPSQGACLWACDAHPPSTPLTPYCRCPCRTLSAAPCHQAVACFSTCAGKRGAASASATRSARTLCKTRAATRCRRTSTWASRSTRATTEWARRSCACSASPPCAS